MSINNTPKISIVTPSYNQGKFLEKTILSVIEQGYPNLEYIIIDGGSTDNSVDIIKKYEQHLTYWVSEKDNGQSEAINKGLSRCTGDIIAWLNSDDYYEPTTFEKVIAAFNESEDNLIVYGDCRILEVNENIEVTKEYIIVPKQISYWTLLKYWEGAFLPPQPSIFWKKSVQDKTNLLSEKLNFGMDLEFWLQLSKHAKFVKINSVLSNYAIHINSKSGSDNGFVKFIPEWKKIINEYVKKESFTFKIRYYSIKFANLITRFFRKDLKKLPMKVLSKVVSVIKKITGIKKFNILSKK